jgi:transcriptional regulator with XRE-family HTH domain
MGRSIDQIIQELSPARQEKIQARAQLLAQEMIDHTDNLAAIRKVFNKTQADIGRALGVNQNAVAQLERRSDLLISTLQRYIKAIGGDLQLVVAMADGTSMILDGFGGLSEPASAKPAGRKPAKAARTRAMDQAPVQRKVVPARKVARKTAPAKTSTGSVL